MTEYSEKDPSPGASKTKIRTNDPDRRSGSFLVAFRVFQHSFRRSGRHGKPGTIYFQRSGVVELVGLEPMVTIHNRLPASLPLAGNLCSLDLLPPSSATGGGGIRSPPGHRFAPTAPKPRKNRPMKDLFFLVGLVGLEPMTPTMSTWSRTRTYDPHDVNVVL